MKKTFTLLIIGFLTLSTLSCNKDEEDNCQEKITQINEYYTEQIILADGNELKIKLLNSEWDIQLKNACK